MELRVKAGALSDSPASESVKNNRQGKEERLLEEILRPENLNLAYKRVRRNGGSHGVDGMRTEELLPYLKTHGESIR